LQGWSFVTLSAAALLGAVMLLAGRPESGLAAECANEVRRVEQRSTDLPDCRAYEMVTPQAKGSDEPLPIELEEITSGRETAPLPPSRLIPVYGARAGIEGNRMAWISEPVPGAPTPGRSHLSTRGPGGWASEDVVPPTGPLNGLLCPYLLGVTAWSLDLTRWTLDLPAGPPRGFFEEQECGHEEPRLVPGEAEHFRNLFLHDGLGGSNRLVNVTPAGVVWPEPTKSLQQYWPASFLAGSDDLSHIVFEEELALTPDAPIGYPGGDELYEWTGGAVRLVSILPDGTPVHGSLAGATRNYAAASELVADQAVNIAQFRHAISADGARVFFEAEGGLFLREDGTRTVQVDESKGSGVSGGGRFMVASRDGSRVFFTDESQLTPDSTAEAGEPDLYEYDVGADQLTDVTANATEAADVLGVSGSSGDGSYVYFVARAALGSGLNSHGDAAIAGQPNLYLIHDGVITFVATLDPTADECDWTQNANCGGGVVGSGLTSRVTESGAFLGFNSVRNLTGYDNTDAHTGEADLEIYLYDAATNRLSCASCQPTGAPPTAGAAIKWPASQGPSIQGGVWDDAYPQRNVSERGQVFFETSEALLPGDNNGHRDVYEYESGQLHLLSTGKSEAGSHFVDATPDGNNVFISTTQRLVGRDVDGLYDYYDARVDGGFAEPALPPVPCEGEGCRGSAAAAPPSVAAGTALFVGPGNPRLARCLKGKRRRHGKCVKRAHRQHKHRRGRAQKAGQRHNSRTARGQRGTVR
jgi:hypothetical protein